MTGNTLLVTCTAADGQQSKAELTVVDAQEAHFLGGFTPEVINGHDVMFWFGEFLDENGAESELKFEICEKVAS